MLLKLLKDRLGRKRTPSDLNELALTHHARGELDKAEAYFREVARRKPTEASAWINLAATLVAQGRHQDAIPVLHEVIELLPELAEAHLDLGICCNRLKDNAAAIGHYRKAIELKPTLAKAHANIINAYLDSCEWDDAERWTAAFLDYRAANPAGDWAQRLEPFCALSLLPGTITREVAVARAAMIEQSVAANPRVIGPEPARPRRGSRIRVGYVSADFHSHATAHLTLRLYETHDRREFEIHAYSMGPDDRSMYRRHIEKTCDRFTDVRLETVEATARRISADGIDVLVDMKGYTAGGRLEIFAGRPAPVQVSYLGYPATTGARFIDYFITDRVATPPGHEAEFTENLVFLPESYQINDSRQPVSSVPVSRAEFGLPAQAFVYCSFNRLRKIDRTIFSIWMDILARVPDSVLWLIGEDRLAEINLRKAAGALGVNPDRLVFASGVEKSVHLARHRLADLFLDTCACNAHTTASDALWAGLPLLTCPGETFARRVAASVLSAARLPELITANLDDYREFAVALARDRDRLARIRQKLAANRGTCPLYDTPKTVAALESAYRRMVELNRAGTAPRSFEASAG